MTFKEKIMLVCIIAASAITSAVGMFFMITLVAYLWEILK